MILFILIFGFYQLQEQGRRFYGEFCQCNDFSCPEDQGKLCAGEWGRFLLCWLWIRTWSQTLLTVVCQFTLPLSFICIKNNKCMYISTHPVLHYTQYVCPSLGGEAKGVGAVQRAKKVVKVVHFCFRPQGVLVIPPFPTPCNFRNFPTWLGTPWKEYFRQKMPFHYTFTPLPSEFPLPSVAGCGYVLELDITEERLLSPTHH